jgi:hypothetical protein
VALIHGLRNSSGNLAILAAILRASSFVSNFAAEPRPGSSSNSGSPLWSRTTKQGSAPRQTRGGGKRRGVTLDRNLGAKHGISHDGCYILIGIAIASDPDSRRLVWSLSHSGRQLHLAARL